MNLKEKINHITLETIVQRDPEQEFSFIDDEIVMLSLKKGHYFTLNPVASKIWGYLEKPIRVEDLIGKLLTEYNVEIEECREDTLECIMDLEQKSLLKKIFDA